MLEQIKSIQTLFVRGGAFYDKSIVFLTMLVLAGCVPPGEEEKEDGLASNIKCEVDSTESVTTGEELVANVTCNTPELAQGRKLQVIYDESLTSLKLVVAEEETIGEDGKLTYTLPNQEQFQAKLKLTGVAEGEGQVKFKILSQKSNWAFTVVRGGPRALTLGADVAASVFTKMQDSSGKAYGRSVMRLDTSETLVSNDEVHCENAPLNALLVSSDDFANCEKVYVQKGANTNYVIIPKQTWALNKTYKVAIKTANGGSAFNRSGNPVSFSTNDANHKTTAHVTRFDAGARPKVLDNQFHLEKDGDLWYYISKGDTLPQYNPTECQEINYQNADDVKFTNLASIDDSAKELARSLNRRTRRYIADAAGNNRVKVFVTTLSSKKTFFHTVGKHPFHIFIYFCSVQIPERT